MLRFSLFGMPVRVRGSFLLIAAFIGFVGAQEPARTATWIGIVFVSILVHELGHAFTARSYGSVVAIELNGLGGLTRWSTDGGTISPGRRAVIAAAGSATGLFFGGVVWLVAQQLGPLSGLAEFTIDNLVFVNVFWGLLNWLPIRPLDGGHLLESLLEKIAPVRGPAIARVVFTVTAAAALIVALQLDLLFVAVLAGWLLLAEFSVGRQSAPPTGLPRLDYGPGDEASLDDVGADSEEPSG